MTGLEGETISAAAAAAPKYMPKYCLADFGNIEFPKRIGVSTAPAMHGLGTWKDPPPKAL